MEMTLDERIRLLAKRAGGTATLAELTGIPKRSLDAYVGGESDVPAERLRKIVEATKVDAAWLLTGEGVSPQQADLRQLVKNVDGAPKTASALTGNAGVQLGHDLVELPLYNVRLSAGEGELAGDEAIIDTRSFRKSWIENVLRASPSALKLAVAHGDSMEPTIHDGDLVMIDTRDVGPKREDIYVLRWGDDVLVKRLQRLPVGGFRVVSDNSRYEPINLMPAQVTEYGVSIIGRVVWWAHTNTR